MARGNRAGPFAGPHGLATLLGGAAALVGLQDLALGAPRAGDDPRPRAGIVDAAPLAPAAVERLAALNAEAALPFTARRSAVHGMARTLSGGRLELGARDLGAAALDFIGRHGALLGLPSGLEPAATVRGRKVALSFRLRGIDVLHAAAMVTFDADGHLVAAAASAQGPARPLGLHALDDVASITAAIGAIDGERARHARAAGVQWGRPQLARAWLATPAGLVPVIRIGLTGDRAGESFEAWVDARDGAPRRVLDRVHRGEGFYPNDPLLIPFETKKAKGSAFKSVAKALSLTPSTRTFKAWSKGIGAPVNLPKGFLTGAHVDIWDANDLNFVSESGVFKTSLLDDPDGFDQANTYYQVEEFFRHLEKQLGFPPASDHSLPVIVNFKTDVPNAFFVADTFPIDGHTVGYLQFHDLDQDFGSIGDFSRDPTVVAHEYVHAWLAFEGESFNDPLDYPTRAVGEAIPDFFACAFHGETVIGEYLDAAFGMGFARDLQDDDHLAVTIDDAIALTATGLPQEHRAGEVMGSLLTDLRLELGTRAAEQLVFAALAGMPDSMVDIGYGVVDAGNAFTASADYLFECAGALLDATLDGNEFAAVIGAATTRGVIGDATSSGDFFYALDGFRRGKIVIPSRFVAGDVQHSYFFTVPAGSTLTVTVSADRDGVLPDFEIVDAATRTLFPYLEPKPRKFSSGDRKVTAKKLELLLGSGEIYEFIVFNDGLDGGYTLTLDS
ncbi:MAG: hypothetical protein FJ293_15315 [Planctomycetes bacterium]|nr:hypothetical protein [Planctomycetota bacterium]